MLVSNNDSGEPAHLPMLCLPNMIIDGSSLAIFRLLYSLIPNRPTDQRQVRWLSTVVVLMFTLFDSFPF